MKFAKPGRHLLGAIAVVAFLLLSLLSCEKRNPTPPGSGGLFPDTPRVLKTYLALGDSYTIGTAVIADQRFPNQAAIQLTQQGVQFKQPDIVATNGWTTGNLLSALSANSPIGTYDIVTLLIGVNNQYQGRTQAEYRTQFTELLNKAIGYAGGRRTRVIVLSIPDYSVTAFAQNSDTARISREINEFNDINKEVSISLAVHYLNITDISREARYDATLIASDGLHPSGKQYARWVTRLTPIIKAAL